MTTGPLLPIAFRARSNPLPPLAAAARGSGAAALARHLLETRDEAALARLSGVRGPGLLLVLGREADLPWIDGIVYLGKDPAAPSLLLPSALEPDVPPALLERAILARAGSMEAPIAVLLDPAVTMGGSRPPYPPALASAGVARPVLRAELQAFLAEAGA